MNERHSPRRALVRRTGGRTVLRGAASGAVTRRWATKPRASSRSCPIPQNRFPRATDNVVGLEQGWRLARAVRETIDADAGRSGAGRSSRSST